MRFFGWLTFVVGSLIFVLGIVMLSVDVMGWLKAGSWEPLGINVLWSGDELQTEWPTLIEGFPFGLLVALAGVGIANVGRSVVNKSEKSMMRTSVFGPE